MTGVELLWIETGAVHGYYEIDPSTCSPEMGFGKSWFQHLWVFVTLYSE